MPKLLPVRIFDCGHERPENIRYLLRQKALAEGKSIRKLRYQKVGEMGYCRECMQERKIIKRKMVKSNA